MGLVQDAISALSAQELREFKYFVQRSSPGSEREDLKLIQELRKGSLPDTGNPKHIHQTTKRIRLKLEQFFILENSKNLDHSKIQNYLDVSAYLSGKNLHLYAWNYLLKAETLAKEKDEYEMLDYIYYSQISYLTRTPYSDISHIHIPSILQKRDENLKLAQIDGNANAAYALLLFEVKEQFSRGLKVNIDLLVNEILNRYDLQHQLDKHPRIYSKIIILVCRALREKKDYQNLLTFSLKSFEQMKEKEILDKIPPDFLMELIRSVYQSSMRTSDFVQAEIFQGIYFANILRFKNKTDKLIYYDFRACIMKADIYMCTNRLEGARELLSGLKEKYQHVKQSAIIYIFLRINLAAMHFKKNEFTECIRLLRNILRQDEKIIRKEEGMGLEILLYTELYLCINCIELDDEEGAWYTIKRIKRKYNQVLKGEDNKRIRNFIRILEKIMSRPQNIKSKSFRTESEKFISLSAYIPGDKEYISLNAWLKARITDKSYYSCFLNQLNAPVNPPEYLPADS